MGRLLLLESLGYLTERIGRCKALLVLCLREGYPSLQRERQSTETLQGILHDTDSKSVDLIELRPIPHGASTEMVKRLLTGRLIAEGQMAVLLERTEGNPMLISGIVREAIETGKGQKEPGWPTFSTGHEAAPKEIRNLIARNLLRINDDDPEARLSLDYAAALGREFSVADLADVMETDVLRLKHRLESLEEIYHIVRVADSPDRYEFDHEITREVILSELGSISTAVHLKVASCLERKSGGPTSLADIATHYRFAERYDDAYRLFGQAAERSSAEFGYAGAAADLEQCLSLVDSGFVRREGLEHGRLLLRLASAEFQDGKFELARTTALRLIESNDVNPALSAESHLIAGECCRYIGTKEVSAEAVRHLEDAVNGFQLLGRQQELGRALSALATVLDHFGNFDKAVKRFGESQKAFNLARDETGLAVLQRKSGMIYDSRRAIGYIGSALETFRRTGATIETARCLNNLGAELMYLGDFDCAQKNLLEALETYRRIDAYEVDASLNNLGVVYTVTGELGKARSMFEEAETRSSEAFNDICSSSNLAILERMEGRPELALSKLESLIPQVEGSGESLIQDYFSFNLATTLASLGRHREALRWLEWYEPNSWKGDAELVKAKRLKAKAGSLRSLGLASEADAALKEAEVLFRTRRPQKWFYELDYYPCDIHILD